MPQALDEVGQSRTTYVICLSMLFLLVLLLHGAPVPFGNELVYLLGPYAQGHPEFLKNDWTFASGWPEHRVFNLGVGLLMLVWSPAFVGWLGRIACWTLILVGLLRLGRRFAIPLSLASLAIALWLAAGQSVVGGDWMMGTFEAKSVAYVLLVFSLDRFLAGGHVPAAISLGLCTSVHPSVGLVCGLAIGAGLLWLRYPWRRLTAVVLLASAFSLPGLLPLLPGLGAGGPGLRGDWRFLTLVRMPAHLDPLWFTRRNVLLLGLLLTFCLLHYRAHREDRALRFLAAFQVALAAVFAAGILYRAAGFYELLRIFPFRVFPVFALLLFFFHLMSAYHHRQSSPPGPILALTALLALVSFTSLPGKTVDQVSQVMSARRPPDDLGLALRWLASNTPNGSVVIMPPWRKDAWYLARRAQIADWDAVRYDRIAEWRQRIESMVGPLADLRPEVANDPATQEARYSGLTDAQIERIASEYGATYLVSKTAYDQPVLYSAGNYRVYALR